MIDTEKMAETESTNTNLRRETPTIPEARNMGALNPAR